MRKRDILKKVGVIKSWKHAEWTLIQDPEAFKEKFNFLVQNGEKADTKNPNDPVWRKPFTYRLDDIYREYYFDLFFCDADGKLKVWYINKLEPKKPKNQGTSANKVFKSVFLTHNGVSERKAFGYCDRTVVGKCIPKQLYYINDDLKNRNLKHISKVDFSSHYPARLCGKMPTWNGRKELPGTVEPTAEYPFAFYIRSGHVAEYQRFDTHKWLDTPLWKESFGANYDPSVDPENDFTILCKASKYTYDTTVKDLYEKKENGEVIEGMPAKIVLNASIGYKHLKNLNNKHNRLDHVASICLCRSNDLMIKNFKKGLTVMIVVDSFIYYGEQKLGKDYKELGALHQEIYDADFRMRGVNQYAFADADGNIIQYSHSGFDKNIECNTLEDIDKWEKSAILTIKKE